MSLWLTTSVVGVLRSFVFWSGFSDDLICLVDVSLTCSLEVFSIYFEALAPH